MLNEMTRVYRWLFARACFLKLNKFLYQCSLHGLGMLNYESNLISGEQVFLKRYLSSLNEGGYVIDVGANQGEYSKEVMEINPNISLYAFEPHPQTFKMLVAKVKRKNFFPINAALGNEDGTLSLYDYYSNDGSEHATLISGVIEGIHRGKSIEHKVRVIRLDDFLIENNIDKIALLKIDTEGNELDVLKGCSQYIQAGKIAAIHFEFAQMNVCSRTFFKDFWDFLPNYEIYRLLPKDMIKIDTYDPISCEIFAYQNFVAIHKKSN